jgi:hypothetical protein
MGTVPMIAPAPSPIAPAPSCPPGYALTPSSSGPMRCVPTTMPTTTGGGYTTPLVPVAPPPIAGWRQQIVTLLRSIESLFRGMPVNVQAPVIGVVVTSPQAQQAGSGLQRVGDPNTSDADAAAAINNAREQYRAMRTNLPAPATAAFDPIADAIASLVPAPVAPPTLLTPVGGQSMIDTVPWVWVAGSFVAGILACSFLTPKRSTPNRRRRRRR